jgi:DNA helicase HerA-like ATPase
MEEGTLGVKHLIVVVDELNKYAPSGGHENYTVTTLRYIAARGRSLGLVLFGAQQFRSRVDQQIIGNCANSAYGHIQMEELSQPGYSVYSQAVREKLATADPGEVMFRHPKFSQPVFLRFPRPPVLRGSDGMRRWQKVKDGELDGVIKLARDLTAGEVHRLLEHVEHGRRAEVIAEITEELSKTAGKDSRKVIQRIIGSDDRVKEVSGLTNPITEI